MYAAKSLCLAVSAEEVPARSASCLPAHRSRGGHCWVCAECSERTDTEKGCSVFCKYSFIHAVNIGSGVLTTLFLLQGPR